jgi:hypothetical protein
MSGECVEASRACLSRMVVGEGKGGIEADEGHSSANGRATGLARAVYVRKFYVRWDMRLFRRAQLTVQT